MNACMRLKNVRTVLWHIQSSPTVQYCLTIDNDHLFALIGWSLHKHRRGPETQRRDDKNGQNLQSSMHLRYDL